MKVQQHPISIEEVIERFPSLRQSLLAKFDDCGLSAFFELEHSGSWSTHPQARGTIFHRFAAECLREMQRNDSETIPVGLAEQIMVFACRQHDVPIEDRVRVPLRQMPELRMAARKFAKDNAFTVRKIVDIERRLEAHLTYPLPGGGLITRTLTGQLDALLFDPPDGAVVIDWKATWGLPPEPRDARPEDAYPDDELRGLSYHGYFQQRFYGWLVMKNYRNVNRVTMREFYAYRTKARKATLTRDQLPMVEEELSVLAEAFDRAVAAGAPVRPYEIETLGDWKPQPGRHCGFCALSRHCPVEEDARLEAGGAITSWERAKRAAAELQVVERVRKVLIEALKGYVETSGEPVPVKGSKGRRVLGWHTTKRGRRFGLYTPDESDRGGHADLDRQLEEAMREAAQRPKRQPPRRGKAGRV